MGGVYIVQATRSVGIASLNWAGYPWKCFKLLSVESREKKPRSESSSNQGICSFAIKAHAQMKQVGVHSPRDTLRNEMKQVGVRSPWGYIQRQARGGYMGAGIRKDACIIHGREREQRRQQPSPAFPMRVCTSCAQHRWWRAGVPPRSSLLIHKLACGTPGNCAGEDQR